MKKFIAFYKKTTLGWFKYSNKGYSYFLGKFKNSEFPIKVINKWKLNTSGTCYFFK
jgi:hypothetical protein